MFRRLTAFILFVPCALTGVAPAMPAPAPRHDVVDDASYSELVEAGTAGEVFRYELSMGAPPRLAGSAALLAAFAERNPRATATQLGVYAAAIDGLLSGEYPSDPDLARVPHFLPAVRFASERVMAPELVGTDVRVGGDALDLLGLAPEAGARSVRAVDFERAKSVDFSNYSPLANLVTGMMLGQTPSGGAREGLAAAMESLASLNGIDLTPGDLAGDYPDIASGLSGLPADYAGYEAERSAAFAGTQAAIDAEFGVLRTRIDTSLTGISAALASEPDQFDAATNAEDPVLVAQLEQDRLDALRERASSRTMLALNTLLIAQSDAAGEQEFARQAQDFSDVQLQTDQTMSDVEGGLAIGGHVLAAAGNFATENPIGGVGELLFAIGGIFGLVDDQGPSADQQIFDQIVDLRQQVEDMRVEMHARFDSIDRQLDIIYQAVSSGLNQLNETTRRIDANVQQISIDLYELRSALTSLEANLYGVLSAGFEQDFIDDMETGLNYRVRTGVDLEYTGSGDNTFFAFHSRFLSRATTIAANEVYAGPATQTLMNDSTAGAQLTSFPLGYNINNLRQFPSQLGLPLWSFGRVANPTTWSLAADAYSQLARENPWYFAKVNENDPSRLQQVIATGESVRTMMRGARNRPLIEALLAQYEARLDALGQAIGLSNWLVNTGYTAALDPWGGLGQDMTGVGPEFSTIHVSDEITFGNVTPWFDTSIVWELFDSRFGLAVAGGLSGYPQSRYSVEYGNTITEQSPPLPTHRMSLTLRDLTGGSNRRFYEVEYGWVGPEPAEGVDQFIHTHPEAVDFVMRAAGGDSATIDGYTILIDNVQVGESFDASAPPSAASVETRLAEIQDEYWFDTNNELSLSPVLELFDALKSSQELLAAYISLGMPESLEQNDLVRATLRGAGSAESGLGGDWLEQAFTDALGANAHPPSITPLHDRAGLLLAQLSPALDSAGDEAHGYVEWSLESLYDLEQNALKLCADDTYAVAPDTTLMVSAANGVMANDAQQPGATAISSALIFPATNGSVTLNPDGSFEYTPNPGFEGDDAFRYISTANLADPGDTPNLITADPATVVIVVSASAAPCIADLTTQNAPVGDPNYGVPDGVVSAVDLQYYVNAWVAGDLAIADLTTQNAPVGDPNYGVPDGVVSGVDLQYFVNAWVAGCP